MIKFKPKKFKGVELQVGRLTDFAYFHEDNQLNGDGKNHIAFVGIILLTYGIILTSTWFFYPSILLIFVLYHYTKNPLKFRYNKNLIWRWGNDKKFKYYWHKRFSFLGLDFYILNGHIFAPGNYLKKDIKQSFIQMEKQLEVISA